MSEIQTKADVAMARAILDLPYDNLMGWADGFIFESGIYDVLRKSGETKDFQELLAKALIRTAVETLDAQGEAS